MDQKFISRLLGAGLCLVLMLMAAAEAEAASRQLSESFIRLHVLANSDSAADQSLKLQVRDAVLEAMEGVIRPGMSITEAQEAITASIVSIRAAAFAHSGGQPVEVTLTREYYPTRCYGDFSLPAGEYISLRILIGEAEGQNWWCVVFPPLCSELCTEEAEAAWGLSEEETALIRGEDGYVIRFRLVEWWAELKAACTG